MEPYCAKCNIPWSECPCDKEEEYDEEWEEDVETEEEN